MLNVCVGFRFKTIAKILFVGLMFVLSTGAQAQTSSQEEQASKKNSFATALDCTKIEIKIDEQTAPLTATEKSALIDKAFYESLSRFDRCQTARLSSSTANSGQNSGGSNDGSGSGGGADQSTASQSLKGEMNDAKIESEAKTENGSVQSVASQSVKGTLPKQDAQTSMEAQSIQEDGGGVSSLKNINVSALGNGKLPEDIPSVDNDSVLEKQIRAAAMAEKDPEIKAKLWNEYRKYKGLSMIRSEKPKGP